MRSGLSHPSSLTRIPLKRDLSVLGSLKNLVARIVTCRSPLLQEERFVGNASKFVTAEVGVAPDGAPAARPLPVRLMDGDLCGWVRMWYCCLGCRDLFSEACCILS